MTHQQKVERFREDVTRRHDPTITVSPPIVRMMWSVGVKVPPLLFWPPAALAAFYGAVGLFSVMLFWWADWLPDAPALQGIIVAGVTVAYGWWGAWYYRRKARKLNLPSWANYPAPDATASPSTGGVT